MECLCLLVLRSVFLLRVVVYVAYDACCDLQYVASDAGDPVVSGAMVLVARFVACGDSVFVDNGFQLKSLGVPDLLLFFFSDDCLRSSYVSFS